MEIRRGAVGSVGRVFQALPAHFGQFFKRPARDVGTSVILQENNGNAAVPEFSANTFQLLAVDHSVNGLTIFEQFPVNWAAPVPPDAQHDLLLAEVGPGRGTSTLAW